MLAIAFVVTSRNRMGRFDVAGRRRADPSARAASRSTAATPWPTAAGGASGSARAGRSGRWLPEAHNDFIFAIIGEELGLPGTLVSWSSSRSWRWPATGSSPRTHDLFVRIATAGIMAWLIGQAIINIGAVIGLLPVIGVPLPLVSSGGSSLITTLFALGILLSFARARTGCAEALLARARARASLARGHPRRRPVAPARR